MNNLMIILTGELKNMKKNKYNLIYILIKIVNLIKKILY